MYENNSESFTSTREKKQQHEMAEKDYIWKQNASKWNVCDWHYSTWELIPQIV